MRGNAEKKKISIKTSAKERVSDDEQANLKFLTSYEGVAYFRSSVEKNEDIFPNSPRQATSGR